MLTFTTTAVFVALRLLLLPSSLVGAVPVISATNSSVANSSTGTPNVNVASSSYWLAKIQHQGAVAFGDSSYKVFRNVHDYGAAGKSPSLPSLVPLLTFV